MIGRTATIERDSAAITGWQFVDVTGSAFEDTMLTLKRADLARLNNRLAVGLARSTPPTIPALIFRFSPKSQASPSCPGTCRTVLSSLGWVARFKSAPYDGYVENDGHIRYRVNF
ncbi:MULTISPECIES: hypothetical protein [unclassified Rhizobium]|uniref:hypothetical protein n=1 Tax=unclassified Rhizobium TaxID=2613769 RepID=UPI0016198304|nr:MULTISPECIES: hypothetical protein [unclassified Rhizobium]MBB3542530.1 hypothetical protein [Rhizobium sp. BK399]MCS3738365.1 hypothetical protein [Rhizobium sp. BK661]MCS4093205.1 hypothetical protein [Rhizobium sp. BK176]